MSDHHEKTDAVNIDRASKQKSETKVFHDYTLRRYLLGDEGLETLEEIEQAALADDHVSEMLEVAEDELIEAYVRGELGEIDKRKFESEFLRGERRRIKMRLSAVLLKKSTKRR